MTLAQALFDALALEIERRRAHLDDDLSIRSVTFTVKINQRTGRPQYVLTTVDSETVCVTGPPIPLDRAKARGLPLAR